MYKCFFPERNGTRYATHLSRLVVANDNRKHNNAPVPWNDILLSG